MKFEAQHVHTEHGAVTLGWLTLSIPVGGYVVEMRLSVEACAVLLEAGVDIHADLVSAVRGTLPPSVLAASYAGYRDHATSEPWRAAAWVEYVDAITKAVAWVLNKNET